jgi:hypothetical protein
MSASEKLKALDDAATRGPWATRRWPHSATTVVGPSNPERPGYIILPTPKEYAELAVALRNALPQIVAVVEAAEAEQEFFGSDADAALSRALTALDEALS